MNTKEIIDRCLRAIGEKDPDNPVEMTRPEVLSLINEFYQNEIGELLRNMTSIVYDGSDADHSITAGAGLLPSDFLLPARVYDGDAPKNKPLEQIFDIDNRESDTSKTSQYMIPNTTEIWIFGKTPTNTIKMYYYAKPEPLEDDSSSSPTALKDKFHVDPFMIHVKEEYALRNNDLADLFDLKALKLDILDAIKKAHKTEKKDDRHSRVRVNRWC